MASKDEQLSPKTKQGISTFNGLALCVIAIFNCLFQVSFFLVFAAQGIFADFFPRREDGVSFFIRLVHEFRRRVQLGIH